METDKYTLVGPCEEESTDYFSGRIKKQTGPWNQRRLASWAQEMRWDD